MNLSLRIHKRDQDVPRALGHVESFVGQFSGVQEHPTLLGVPDGAVVLDKATATSLKVSAGMVERDVDGVGRGVFVRKEGRLLFRVVPDHEVHQSHGRWLKVDQEFVKEEENSYAMLQKVKQSIKSVLKTCETMSGSMLSMPSNLSLT